MNQATKLHLEKDFADIINWLDYISGVVISRRSYSEDYQIHMHYYMKIPHMNNMVIEVAMCFPYEVMENLSLTSSQL